MGTFILCDVRVEERESNIFVVRVCFVVGVTLGRQGSGFTHTRIVKSSTLVAQQTHLHVPHVLIPCSSTASLDTIKNCNKYKPWK